MLKIQFNFSNFLWTLPIFSFSHELFSLLHNEYQYDIFDDLLTNYLLFTSLGINFGYIVYKNLQRTLAIFIIITIIFIISIWFYFNQSNLIFNFVTFSDLFQTNFFSLLFSLFLFFLINSVILFFKIENFNFFYSFFFLFFFALVFEGSNSYIFLFLGYLIEIYKKEEIIVTRTIFFLFFLFLILFLKINILLKNLLFKQNFDYDFRNVVVVFIFFFLLYLANRFNSCTWFKKINNLYSLALPYFIYYYTCLFLYESFGLLEGFFVLDWGHLFFLGTSLIVGWVFIFLFIYFGKFIYSKKNNKGVVVIKKDQASMYRDRSIEKTHHSK